MWPVDHPWRAPVGDFPPSWASAWGDDVYGLWADLTVNGVTQRMRWIEPSGPEGFFMGSTKKERAAIKHKEVRGWANQREHEPMRIPVMHGFWLADTPCTQAFWQAVTGKNPSHFSKGRDAPERPVENVSWKDVDEHFIECFAQTPEWGTDDRLCLPSEEEWEYAARAGTRSAYWWGDDWDAARGNADVTGERRWEDKEGTTPVHRYAPNPWGLFDVHGNVWEWCSAPWRPRRDALEAWPHEDTRVVRGGSWFLHPGGARAACRDWWPRGVVGRDQGFRFALRSPAGPEARGKSDFPLESPQRMHDAAVISSQELSSTNESGSAVALPEKMQRALEQGRVEFDTGNLSAAQAQFEMAIEIGRQITVSGFDAIELQRFTADSHQLLADVLRRQFHLVDALMHYEESWSIRAALATRDPDNAGWQRDLGVIFEKLGEVLQLQGNLAGAQRRYEAGLLIREALVARDPENAGWQRDLSVSFDELGGLLQRQGDLLGAQRYYEASLRIRMALAARDPENAGRQHDLIVNHHKLGDVLQAQGDLPGAQRRYEASLPISEALVARDPENIRWQHELFEIRLAMGQVSGILGNEPDRQMHWGKAKRMMRALVKRWPQNPQFRDDLEMIEVAIKESKVRRFPWSQ
jgi:formylglycine-generating enzyme required for sulfatase activity/tetratricopeptide (TPR) repeat protein